MINTKTDFEKRKIEIEEYFEFLKIIDDENTKLKFLKDDNLVEEKISPQLNKILLANGFLLLYNLIEATVRNSIIEIFNVIKENNICYEQLTNNIKKIWIKQRTENLKENKFKIETLHQNIYDIIDEILNKEIISLLKENLNFSGNLDAQKIRELAKEYGFKSPANGRN